MDSEVEQLVAELEKLVEDNVLSRIQVEVFTAE